MTLFDRNQLEEILGDLMRLTSVGGTNMGIDLAQDTVFLIESVDVDAYPLF